MNGRHTFSSKIIGVQATGEANGGQHQYQCPCQWTLLQMHDKPLLQLLLTYEGFRLSTCFHPLTVTGLRGYQA